MGAIAKFLLLLTIIAATVQVQVLGQIGGGGGALGLDVFKELGNTDDPGYKLIDADLFVSRRRAAASRGRAAASFSPRGPQGAPGAPPVAAGDVLQGPGVDVDLCYLVDATGSMAPHIKAVKDSIRETVEALTSPTGGVGVLRLCFVAYRDVGDVPNVETLPLTTDVSRFLSFVDGLKATGGADLPEDIYSGLEEIGRQSWNAKKRIVLHIADAPCHGDGCGGGTKDSRGRKADDVFLPFRVKKLKYNFGRIHTRTDTMMKLFRDAYGFKIPLFDVSPDISEPTRERKLPGAPGAPGVPGVAWASWGPAGGTGPAVVDGNLKEKVGKATQAAVLLEIFGE